MTEQSGLAAEVARADEAARRAPAPLDLVQALVNTLNRIRGYDLLADVPTARWWLSGTAPDLPADDLQDADLVELIRLREALRALLRSTTSGTAVADDALADLEQAGRDHPLALRLGADGTRRLTPAPAEQGPAAELTGRVLAALANAAGPDPLHRLKTCANPGCEWAFYDTSRSRSGSWCNMNTCGARHKMARYRNRQRSSGGSDADGSGGTATNGKESTGSHGPPR